MLYSEIKKNMELMIEDITAGKEECQKVLSFNLIRDQNVPITVKSKLLYPLEQIKFSIYCPFLLVTPDVEFAEIYRLGEEEDFFKLLRLISKFATVLDMMKEWIEKDAPDMIRWGEGVIFDKQGRTTKIPFTMFNKY
jgi:hypothetical protein